MAGTKQLKLGVILSYFNIGLTIIVSLIYTPYLLRMLGQSEYGLFSLSFAAMGAFLVLDLGMGNANIRYTARYRSLGYKKKENMLHGMFFRIYLFMGIVALLTGLVLYHRAGLIFSASMSASEIQRLKSMLLFIVPSVALALPLSVFDYILKAYERFVFVKIVELIRIISIPVISVILLLLGFKALGLVAVIAILNVLIRTLSMGYCLRFLNIKINLKQFDKALFKEIFTYSSFVFIAAIASRADKNINQFVLGIVSGTIPLAIYALGFSLFTNYKMLSHAMQSLLLPVISKIPEDGKQLKVYNSYFISVGRMKFFVLVLFYIGFVFFGRQFIVLWAGADYEQAYFVCLALISVYSIYLLQAVGVTVLQAQNKHRFNSVLFLVMSLANIPLSVYLSRQYGAAGAAISLATVWFIGHGVIMNIYYHKVAGLNVVRYWGQIIRATPSLVAPVAFALGYLYVYDADNWLSLAAGTISFLVIYAASVVFFGLNDFEKSLVVKPITKWLQNFMFNNKQY